MSFDLSRFNQTFFDESREHVRTLEERLIELDAPTVDAELFLTSLDCSTHVLLDLYQAPP